MDIQLWSWRNPKRDCAIAMAKPYFRTHRPNAQYVQWPTLDSAHAALTQWILTHYQLSQTLGNTASQQGRFCVAITGCSGSGKTTVARYLKQSLQQQGIQVWLLRRDEFIRKSEPGRWFDYAATVQVQGHLQHWLAGVDTDQTLAGLQGGVLQGKGIVLLEDLRSMPSIPYHAVISLLGSPARLTCQEEQRNQAQWPWWEHSRRNWIKFRYQRYLLAQAKQSIIPWIIACWNPTQQSSAWIAPPLIDSAKE